MVKQDHARLVGSSVNQHRWTRDQFTQTALFRKKNSHPLVSYDPLKEHSMVLLGGGSDETKPVTDFETSGLISSFRWARSPDINLDLLVFRRFEILGQTEVRFDSEKDTAETGRINRSSRGPTFNPHPSLTTNGLESQAQRSMLKSSESMLCTRPDNLRASTCITQRCIQVECTFVVRRLLGGSKETPPTCLLNLHLKPCTPEKLKDCSNLARSVETLQLPKETAVLFKVVHSHESASLNVETAPARLSKPDMDTLFDLHTSSFVREFYLSGQIIQTTRLPASLATEGIFHCLLHSLTALSENRLFTQRQDTEVSTDWMFMQNLPLFEEQFDFVTILNCVEKDVSQELCVFVETTKDGRGDLELKQKAAMSNSGNIQRKAARRGSKQRKCKHRFETNVELWSHKNGAVLENSLPLDSPQHREQQQSEQLQQQQQQQQQPQQQQQQPPVSVNFNESNISNESDSDTENFDDVPVDTEDEDMTDEEEEEKYNQAVIKSAKVKTTIEHMDNFLIIWHAAFLIIFLFMLAVGIALRVYFTAIIEKTVKSSPNYVLYSHFVRLENIPEVVEFGDLNILLGNMLIILSACYVLCTAGYMTFLLHRVTFIIPVFVIISGVVVLVEVNVINIYMSPMSASNEEAKKHLRDKAITEYQVASDSTFSVTYDLMSIWGQCCGIVDQYDFQTAQLKYLLQTKLEEKERILQVPPTCCQIQIFEKGVEEVVECASTAENIYPTGCYSQLYQWLRSYCNLYSVLVFLQLIDLSIHIILYKKHLSLLTLHETYKLE